MTKTRLEFIPEFKREAAALLEGSDQPLMQIATELGISPPCSGTGEPSPMVERPDPGPPSGNGRVLASSTTVIANLRPRHMSNSLLFWKPRHR
jgi:transposase